MAVNPSIRYSLKSLFSINQYREFLLDCKQYIYNSLFLKMLKTDLFVKKKKENKLLTMPGKTQIL